jgi:hypothetical protein
MPNLGAYTCLFECTDRRPIYFIPKRFFFKKMANIHILCCAANLSLYCERLLRLILEFIACLIAVCHVAKNEHSCTVLKYEASMSIMGSAYGDASTPLFCCCRPDW